ncbi:MAG: hypothetical protein ACJAUW_001635, partial [Yoonia sp.]
MPLKKATAHIDRQMAEKPEVTRPVKTARTGRTYRRPALRLHYCRPHAP